MRQALTRAAAGDLVGALAAWREALESGVAPDLGALARPTMARVEGRAPRGGAHPPASDLPEEPANPAWERAWAGDYVGARQLAGRHAYGSGADALHGVLDVLQGSPARGLALLDRAMATGEPREDLQLHRARALIHLGRIEEAQGALLELVNGESLSRRVLIALGHAHAGSRRLADFQSWGRRVSASDAHLNGLFSTELPAILGRSAVLRALDSREALLAFLENMLDRMAGNLGRSPTFAEAIAGGSRRFVRLVVPPTSRTEAVAALHAIRHLGPEGAEAALWEVLGRHPRSVFAHTYRGELYLWLGRYDEAMTAFAAATSIEPARWAAIGMLAALLLTGRLRRARFMALCAEQHFSYIAGSTLPVYRGALRRRTGRVAEAIEDLHAALETKATRVGARMELCLALRAAGRRHEAADHAAVLIREAPAPLIDAADALDLDWRSQPALLVADGTIEEALRTMRGNRSSSIVTWIDRTGELRILEPRSALQQEARRTLSMLG